MSSDQQIEKQIQEKGLIAPRITPDHIESVIADKQFIHDGNVLTICVLTLQNGFTVTGESACASPENFDAKLGRGIALRNAKDKIWALEGYLLKQKLYEEKNYTWQSRLEEEHNELRNRVEKLTEFIKNNPEHKNIKTLRAQLGAAKENLRILEERVTQIIQDGKTDLK